MEPESVRRWGPAFLVAMETAVDDTDGRGVGLGAPSRTVEALRHLSLSRTEELCLAVSVCRAYSRIRHCNKNLNSVFNVGAIKRRYWYIFRDSATRFITSWIFIFCYMYIYMYKYEQPV